MSEVVILVKHKGNGFCEVSVDGKYAGTLEDPDEVLVTDTLREMIKLMELDNTIVKEKQ